MNIFTKIKRIKNISETKMEDFTLAELKNVARDEGLSGWSKFKKDALFDFLVANNVDITKYKKPKKCIKKSLENVVTQALDENVEVVDNNLNVKTKNELCKNLAKKKKEDIVQQALKFNIDINRPNGKLKTIKELLEDISLKLLLDQQVVIEAAPVVSFGGAGTSGSVAACKKWDSLSKCLKKKKKDVVTEAILLGINITHPNKKVKTVKELCKEIELIISTNAPVSPQAPSKKDTVAEALAMGINISHPSGKVKTVKELDEEITLKKFTRDFSENLNVQENFVVAASAKSASSVTECVITDEGNEICIKSQQHTSPEECVVTPSGDIECNSQTAEETCVVTSSGDIECNSQTAEETCVVTPSGDIECNSQTAEEICVVAQACATDDTTGETTCAPVNVCANQQPGSDTKRQVNTKEIERQLAEISNPHVTFNQNIMSVKETVYKSLGLI